MGSFYKAREVKTERSGGRERKDSFFHCMSRHTTSPVYDMKGEKEKKGKKNAKKWNLTPESSSK